MTKDIQGQHPQCCHRGCEVNIEKFTQSLIFKNIFLSPDPATEETRYDYLTEKDEGKKPKEIKCQKARPN